MTAAPVPTSSREEWLEFRRNTIGGSDVPAILGWSPYATREDVRAEKLKGHTKPDSKAMQRGRLLEPAILAWVAEEYGVEYDARYAGTAWVDGWQHFTPDAVTTDGILIEAKTTGARDLDHGWGRAGGFKGEVPLHYTAQIVWGLGLLGLKEAWCAVLSGAPTFGFARYRIKFNPDHYAFLVDKARHFYDQLTEARQAA